MNLAANIEITINDQTVRIPRAVSLKTLLDLKSIRAERGVAVAINGDVVPKEQWSATILKDLDKVMVITAAQGG